MEFNPKMVEAVARGVWDANAPVSYARWDCSAVTESGPSDTEKKHGLSSAEAALTALCAHLNLPPEALNALAKGEAVVVPRRDNETIVRELRSMAESHRAGWRRMILEQAAGRLAASPYANGVKGGGDE